jgi:UDP-3-O-[3-hydroxymyristoyl] glucosamine N-acyltransferase
MDLALSIEEISRITRPQKVAGASETRIRRIAALADAQEGDLSFLANPKYRKEVGVSRASLIFVPADYEGEAREGQVLFFQENTSLALAAVCNRIEQELWPKPVPGIHATAHIGKDCRVSPTASIGPFCILEEGVSIGDGTYLQGHCLLARGVSVGDDCRILGHVTVQGHCRIGNRVVLHPGVVIGGDGFGYDTNAEGHHQKLPQVGEVLIQNDVEIGANTTIDRARFDRTEIGEGTKIDNLVQIGHNVIIGRHCLIVSQVGIAGSTHIEDHVVIGGQAGIAGHIRIGRGSMLGAKAGVGKDLPPKSYVSGAPALPIMLYHKVTALRKRLPDLFRDVEQLSQEVKKLSNRS